jgi:4-alpha-glucanotransferase
MDRGSGILLPVFALPSKYGIGTFGKEARKFVKYLVSCKQKYWQMLPLNPTSYGDSPYQSFSAFAINPYFIDLTELKNKGFITKEDLSPLNHRYSRYIDYGEEYEKRFPILHKAFLNSKDALKDKLDKFAKSNRAWLDDYALFMVIKGLHQGKAWSEWEDEYRLRNKNTLKKVKEENAEEILFWIWTQYMASYQYKRMKRFANHHGIKIIGDIPIYVAMDSADVWANYKEFQLDKDRRPVLVAGVPPDYFSATGQLWGNPLYDYEKMKKNGFRWWKKRVKKCTKLFDILRIDHFRGMESYWAIPGQDKTAINGHWVLGPGLDLVNAIKVGAGKMEIIAEDLGLLTPEVLALKEKAMWPGLVVMEFGFDPNDKDFKNVYLPENYKKECVAYLGTHDNDTLAHFFLDKKELLPTILRYFHAKGETKVTDVELIGNDTQAIPELSSEQLINLQNQMLMKLMTSKAELTIFLLQDFLYEGGEYRINTPGTPANNWRYRTDKDFFKDKEAIARIAAMTVKGAR